jgi:macrolide transport system ATP-binding/permease protein
VNGERSRKVYRFLLRALPARFRTLHGREMEEVFTATLHLRRLRGRGAWLMGWGAGVADLAAAAVRLRLAGRGHRPRRGRGAGFEAMRRDLRTAVRSLGRAPGFSLVAVLTLALGIGANTALFSVVNALLLRPQPHVADPERVVAIYTSNASGPAYGMSSWLDFLDFRERTPGIEDAVLVTPAPLNLAGADGLPRTRMGEFVSANYFRMLGVPLALGRGFTADEAHPASGAAVVVLGHGTWQREFGGDPGVVGRTVRISGQSMTVVGVAPEGFRGALPVVTSAFWLPVPSQALIQGMEPFERRSLRSSMIRARLAPDGTVAGVQASLTGIAAALQEADPEAWTDRRGQVRRVSVIADTRLPPQLRGAATGFTALLAVAAGLVLLIACANVAHLTLARASVRGREMAVRLSLGAGPRQIVRQLLTENLLLAAGGAIAGVALAALVLGRMDALPPLAGVLVDVDVGMDARVLLFATGLAVVAMVATGLLPALKAARRDVSSALKQGPTDRGGRGSRFRDALVVGQVAASLVLLVGAGLFLRSVQVALRVDPGFEVAHLATLGVDLGPEGYAPDQAVALLQALQERVEALPGVSGAALTHALPMTPVAMGRNGARPAEGEALEASSFPFFHVGPGFAETMGMEVVAGREFTGADGADDPGVIVVNEAMARRFWPGLDPLGRTVIWGGGREATVVGVLADARTRTPREPAEPAYFVPLLQHPMASLTLATRTSPGATAEVMAFLRDAIQELDPRLAGIASLQTMDDVVALTLLPHRVAARILTVVGVLGVFLAAVGLYGVVSFLVARRTREVGVRMALGARGGQVVGLVVGRGLWLALLGTVIGLGLAAAATRFLGALLYGVSPLDPAVFVGMTLGTLAVAGISAWVPARRAASVDPVTALRTE